MTKLIALACLFALVCAVAAQPKYADFNQTSSYPSVQCKNFLVPDQNQICSVTGPNLNASCSSSLNCWLGYVCSTDGICILPGYNGQACVDHTNCLSNICTSGTCTPAANNTACVTYSCATGFYCNDDTKICVAQIPKGAGCDLTASDPNQCANGFICYRSSEDDDFGNCTRAYSVPNKGLCDNSYECIYPSTCIDNVCTPIPSGGQGTSQNCSDATPCANGLTCANASCIENFNANCNEQQSNFYACVINNNCPFIVQPFAFYPQSIFDIREAVFAGPLIPFWCSNCKNEHANFVSCQNEGINNEFSPARMPLDSDDLASNSGLEGWQIALIIIGCALVIIIVVVVVVVVVKKKKQDYIEV